ncbi:MAG: hypothetical protein ACLUSL_13370 [Ruminococcus sp.]
MCCCGPIGMDPLKQRIWRALVFGTCAVGSILLAKQGGGRSGAVRHDGHCRRHGGTPRRQTAGKPNHQRRNVLQRSLWIPGWF